jgi:hypothetical protein
MTLTDKQFAGAKDGKPVTLAGELRIRPAPTRCLPLYCCWPRADLALTSVQKQKFARFGTIGQALRAGPRNPDRSDLVDLLQLLVFFATIFRISTRPGRNLA